MNALVLVALTLMLLTSHPAHAADIVCGNMDDGPAIQSALDAGGVVQLAGDCRLTTTPLLLRTPLTEVRGPARLLAVGMPWMAFMTTREVLIENVEWHNPDGGGLVIDTPPGAPVIAGALRLVGGKFNTFSPGLYAAKGTGLWVWGTHFNGLRGGMYAAMILEWDTAAFTDVLVEEHWACLRFGSAGTTANVSLVNVKCDRLTSVGHLIEPWGAGTVQNVQDWNGWWAQGLAPYLINASETTGYVGRIVIRNGLSRDQAMQDVWFAGPVDRTNVVTEIQFR